MPFRLKRIIGRSNIFSVIWMRFKNIKNKSFNAKICIAYRLPEWEFSVKAAPEAENFVFHPDQETIKNKDGSLTVKFRAGGTLEMAWHLYTWGKEVKVVKPRNFWKRVELAEQNRWS